MDECLTVNYGPVGNGEDEAGVSAPGAPGSFWESSREGALDDLTVDRALHRVHRQLHNTRVPTLLVKMDISQMSVGLELVRYIVILHGLVPNGTRVYMHYWDQIELK